MGERDLVSLDPAVWQRNSAGWVTQKAPCIETSVSTWEGCRLKYWVGQNLCFCNILWASQLVVKNLLPSAGDVEMWVRSPGGGHGNPLQYSCLENPMDKSHLVGYSPWGCKELDTTQRLSTHTHMEKHKWTFWPTQQHNPIQDPSDSEHEDPDVPADNGTGAWAPSGSRQTYWAHHVLLPCLQCWWRCSTKANFIQYWLECQL